MDRRQGRKARLACCSIAKHYPIGSITARRSAALLGRPVKLVYYDDQSNPSTVPGIYTNLLDVDKVDLIIGAYATAQIAPAMPIVMTPADYKSGNVIYPYEKAK